MRTCVECAGEVPVALPVADALTLFTPEGERSWVPGWAPRYPVGGRPEPATGLAFVTGEGDEARSWVVARYDPEAGAASYVYVLPGRRAAHIEVVAATGPEGGTRVGVTYRVTSLSAGADAAVRAFGEGFDAMLEEWSARIAEHLEDRQR